MRDGRRHDARRHGAVALISIIVIVLVVGFLFKLSTKPETVPRPTVTPSSPSTSAAPTDSTTAPATAPVLPTITPTPTVTPPPPPPPPNCGKRKMLNPRQTRCIPNPAWVPVSVPAETLRLVDANLRQGLPPAQFGADYRRILATKPDFITLQEVPGRSDEQLEAGHYGIYRSHDSPYTAETPVLWDTTRWKLTSSGTRYLTTRQVKWGVRAVNWVTLKSLTTHRVISIISCHPAPTLPRTRGLLSVFVANLKPIVAELGEKGPVLVAGDFNAGYRGSLYQAAGLPSSGLTPTYSEFGPLATGRYHNATIDYMFNNANDYLTPTAQGRWLQNSDHYTVWSQWTLSTPDSLIPAKLAKALLTHNATPVPQALASLR